MEELEKLLKNRKFDFNKLVAYGFIENGNQCEYKSTLIEGEFDIVVKVSKDGKIDSKVIDIAFGDEYLLVKMPDATGEYVGKVREAYSNVLTDIIIKCSRVEVFKSNQAKQVIKYVKEKYDNEPEFLWEKFDNNAVFRHLENKKWYGILLTISRDKLGLDSKENVEIIDLKISPEDIEKIIDNEKYFLGYHMNKKHWFTIILDGSVPIEKIFEYIDMSYNMK